MLAVAAPGRHHRANERGAVPLDVCCFRGVEGVKGRGINGGDPRSGGATVYAAKALDAWNVGQRPATLPATPGDVGRRPLSIPRRTPSGERLLFKPFDGLPQSSLELQWDKGLAFLPLVVRPLKSQETCGKEKGDLAGSPYPCFVQRPARTFTGDAFDDKRRCATAQP